MKALIGPSFLTLLLVLACANALPAARRSLPRIEWNLGGSIGLLYDDNLIGLSRGDRSHYLSSPGSFPTPLESADDLETQIGLNPSIRWRAPYTLLAVADYRLKVVKRLKNEMTDYQTHSISFSFRPRISGYRWSVRLRSLIIPTYYLRVYRDRDFNQYHSSRYSQFDYSAGIRYRLADRAWLDGESSFGSYYYNSKFTEYDSEYKDFGGGFSYRFPQDWSVSGKYLRRMSDNIGVISRPTDEMAGVAEDTEYGDSDYDEDEFGASLQLPSASIVKRDFRTSFSLRHRRRVYTTNRALVSDPFHRGRLDRRTQFSITIETDISHRLGTSAFATYDERKTKSDAPQVPLVKNFVRHEFGMLFTYQFR